MQDAQDKLLKSYQAQAMFVPDGGVSAVNSSISKLNEDYVEAQARRIGLEAELQEVADMRRRGRSMDSLPRVAADATMLELTGKRDTLRVDVSRLKEKYKQAHPEVQKLQLQIDQINKTREARALQIEEGLRAEYRQLQRREGSRSHESGTSDLILLIDAETLHRKEEACLLGLVRIRPNEPRHVIRGLVDIAKTNEPPDSILSLVLIHSPEHHPE